MAQHGAAWHNAAQRSRAQRSVAQPHHSSASQLCRLSRATATVVECKLSSRESGLEWLCCRIRPSCGHACRGGGSSSFGAWPTRRQSQSMHPGLARGPVCAQARVPTIKHRWPTGPGSHCASWQAGRQASKQQAHQHKCLLLFHTKPHLGGVAEDAGCPPLCPCHPRLPQHILRKGGVGAAQTCIVQPACWPACVAGSPRRCFNATAPQPDLQTAYWAWGRPTGGASHRKQPWQTCSGQAWAG